MLINGGSRISSAHNVMFLSRRQKVKNITKNALGGNFLMIIAV